MKRELALGASFLTVTFSGLIAGIEIYNNLQTPNQDIIECGPGTEWETSYDSPRPARVLIWTQRVIAKRNRGTEIVSFDNLPKFDQNVWDNRDLVACPSEEGGWVVITRNGLAIELKDLINPDYLYMHTEEWAHYNIPLPNREHGIPYEDMNRIKDICLSTGQVFERGQFNSGNICELSQQLALESSHS